jgi:hypothetical protein
LRKMPRADAQQRGAEAAQDHCALCGAHGLAQRWSGAMLTQALFDLVEQSDLPQQPADGARGAFACLIDGTARVCPAAGERDGLRSGASIVLMPTWFP